MGWCGGLVLIFSVGTAFVTSVWFWSFRTACLRRVSSISCLRASEMLALSGARCRRMSLMSFLRASEMLVRISCLVSVKVGLERVIGEGAAVNVMDGDSVVFSLRRVTVVVLVVDIVDIFWEVWLMLVYEGRAICTEYGVGVEHMSLIRG